MAQKFHDELQECVEELQEYLDVLIKSRDLQEIEMALGNTMVVAHKALYDTQMEARNELQK